MKEGRETGHAATLPSVDRKHLSIRSSEDYRLDVVPVGGDIVLSVHIQFKESTTRTVILVVENGHARLSVVVSPSHLAIAGLSREHIDGQTIHLEVKMSGRNARVVVDGNKVRRIRNLPSTDSKRVSVVHRHGRALDIIETNIAVTARDGGLARRGSLFSLATGLFARRLGAIIGPRRRMLRALRLVLPKAFMDIERRLSPRDRRAMVRALGELDRWAATLPVAKGERVVLVMRGRRGSRWFHSPTSGWALWDLYVEGVPEALITQCRERGWRLTIVYEGLLPEYDDKRRGYAERYPDVVDEVATADLGGIFAVGRTAREVEYFRLVDELVRSASFQAGFSYRGVDFFDEMKLIVTAAIPRYSALYDLRYRAWIEIFSRLRPAAVFGGRLEVRPDINAAARKLGVKSTTIKLGVSEEMLPPYIAFHADGTFDQSALPDLTLVWGDRQKELLRRRFPEFSGAIEAAGRTRNDSFVNELSSVNVNSVRRRIGLSLNERAIVYGATSRTRYGLWPGAPWGACCLSPLGIEEGLRALLRAADRLPGVRVIVKPHPADSVELIMDMVRRVSDPRVRLITDQDGFHNLELLSLADMFVSSVSSMFGEAVMCGCLPINLWTPDVNFLYEENRHSIYKSISVSVHDFDTLTEAVVKLMTDEELRGRELHRARERVEEFFGRLDGHNAERAAALGIAEAIRDQ